MEKTYLLTVRHKTDASCHKFFWFDTEEDLKDFVKENKDKYEVMDAIHAPKIHHINLMGE